MAAPTLEEEEEEGLWRVLALYQLFPITLAWVIFNMEWSSLLHPLLAVLVLFLLVLRVLGFLLACLGLGDPRAFTLSGGWQGYQRKAFKLELSIHHINLHGKVLSAINRSLGRRVPLHILEATIKKLAVTLAVEEWTLSLDVEEVVVVGRMTHVEEWDEGWMMERMARLKREQANLTSLLIEPEPPPGGVPKWQRWADRLINTLSLEVLVGSLRIEDQLTQTCMGITFDRYTMTHSSPSEDSLGATPSQLEVVELRLYCDAIRHTQEGASPAELLHVGMWKCETELPDLFQVMMQPEVMPGGRGKRLRLRLKVYDVQMHIREDQMTHFLYHNLTVFFSGEFSAWRLDVIRKHALACRPLTDEESGEYMALYNALRAGGGAGGGGGGNGRPAIFGGSSLARLEALETIMSYGDIVRTRYLALLPQLEPCQASDPRDPHLEVDETHPLASQFNHLAAYVAKHWNVHESRHLWVREIDVEEIYAENMEFRFYQASLPGTPPFQGPLEQVLYGGSLAGHVKYLMALDSQGRAVGYEEELQTGKLWIDVEGLGTSLVVVDERVDPRDPVGSRITPFLLVGPYRSAAGEDEAEVAPWSASPDIAGDPNLCNLRGVFKMCRSTRKKEIGAYFQDCRLATYVPRIRDVLRNVKLSFRWPLDQVRPWMEPDNVQAFRGMGALRRRREEVVLWDRRHWSKLFEEPMSPGMSVSGPAVEAADEVVHVPSPLERLRIFNGWRSHITFDFNRCEFILIEDLENTESGTMLLALTGALVVDSSQEHEAIKVDGMKLQVFPAIPNAHELWMPPTGTPYIFPTRLQDSVGLAVASRRILDDVSLSLSYSLAPKKRTDLQLQAPSRDWAHEVASLEPLSNDGMISSPPSTTPPHHGEVEGASPLQSLPSEAIPRYLRVFVKQARLMELSDSVETVGLANPGVVVTCEGQRRVGRSTSRDTAMPWFDLDFGFLYSTPKPKVTLDIVDFVGEGTSRWNVVASCNLVIDAVAESDSGMTHWERLHVANEGSAWWGNVEVQAMWGSRLLGVTIHRLQNIVRFGEERDFHPFVRVAVEGTSLRTSEFNTGMDMTDVEEDFIFRSMEEEPIIVVSLHNQGRVHDEELGRAKISLRRECAGEWFWLLSGRTVMGEVKASIRWIHSLAPEPGVTVDSMIAASLMNAEVEEPMDRERRASYARHLSFDMALDAYHRQSRQQWDEVITVHSVEVSLSPVTVRVTDADLMVMRGILHSWKVKPMRHDVGVSRQSSPVKAAGTLSPAKTSREKLGKRHLYNLFKEFDDDKDGRLSLGSLRVYLLYVGERLPLLRSELEEQVETLLKALDFEADSLVSWKALRDALERGCLVFEHGDLVRDLYCDELVSRTVVREILAWSPKSWDFPLALAHAPPEEDFTAFWDLYEHETGATKSDLGEDQTPLNLQVKLVRLLRSYRAAKDAWGTLVLPAIYGLPECRCLSRDTYAIMSSPVSVGDGVFVDAPCEIKHLPPVLHRQVLTGICTAHRDRTSTGAQHLTFTLTQDGLVYLCYDTRLKKQPKWLAQEGFVDTGMMVETAHSRHRVFKRFYEAGTVSLGGNEGRKRHCSNYFVLVGLGTNSSNMPFGTVPPWLLSERVLASPTETLHDYLLASFGIGRRKAQAIGSTPSSIVKASRGKTHILVLHAAVTCPSFKCQLLDVWDIHQSPRLTACLSNAELRLDLEHTLTKEWLGRYDRLAGTMGFSLMGQYFNPVIEATEYFLEPWSLNCLLDNADDSPLTNVRVQAQRHCNINISAPLMQAVKSIIHPPSQEQMRGQYRRDLQLEGETGWSKRSRILLTNNLGATLTVRCNHQGCFFEPVSDDIESSITAANEVSGLEDDGEEEYDHDPFHLVSVVLREKQSVVYVIISADIRRQDQKRRTVPPVEVHVHGWKSIEQVKVQWQGCHAYPLLEEVKKTHVGSPGLNRTGSTVFVPHGEKELKRSASSGNLQGINSRGRLNRPELLVVEAKERDAQWVCDGKELVGMLQFRSNVRLINMSSTAVDASLGRRGEGTMERVVLNHEEIMHLPINAVTYEPTLQVRRLSDVRSSRNNSTLRRLSTLTERGASRRRSAESEDSPRASSVAGEASPSSPYFMAGPEHGDLDPVPLHPVLFDPTIHDALRRTKALEERSMSLEYTVLGMLGEPESGAEEGKMKWKPKDDAVMLKQKERSRMMMDWTIAILPPYQVVNSLPCSITVEVLQPIASARDCMDPTANNQPTPNLDRAQDLFAFPVGLMNDSRDRGNSGDFEPMSPPSSSPSLASDQDLSDHEGEEEEQGGIVTGEVRNESLAGLSYLNKSGGDTTTQSSGRSPSMVIWRGVIESGAQQSLEEARLDRSLYIRVKLKPGGQWSETIKVPARVHLNRPSFNQSPPIPVFQGTPRPTDDYAHVQMVRRWRFKGTRRLMFYSDYWVINKTHLALGYKRASSSSSRPNGNAGAVPVQDHHARRRSMSLNPVVTDQGFSDGGHLDRFGTRTTIPLMVSCPGKTMEIMPYAMTKRATNPGFFTSELTLRSSSVNYLLSGFEVGSRMYADSDMEVTSLPKLLATSPQLHAIITCRQRVANPDSEEDLLSFRLSEDAHVIVCLAKGSTKDDASPGWLASRGFRPLQEFIATTGSTYQLYRRFFSRGSLVVLGGRPEMDNGLSPEKAPPSKPRVVSESSYFVLLTTHDASDVDIQGLQVQRDFTNRIFCNRRYATLPDFQAGDRMYVDREYCIGALPPLLTGRKLLAILTAQGDRKATGGYTLSFTVRKKCLVVLAYDRRAKSLPLWINALGFRGTGQYLPGPDHDYELFEVSADAGTTLALGPNSAPRSLGSKRMYFLMIRGDDDGGSEGDANQWITAKEEAALVAAIQGKGDRGVKEEEEEAGGVELPPDESGNRLRVSIPLFDQAGRDWSAPFNIDAVNTTGQVETPCAVFGVSIVPLPGVFHRTKAITLCPRFVVVNKTDKDLEVLPLMRVAALSTPTTLRTKVGAILPKALVGQSRGRTSTLLPFLSKRACVEALPVDQCLALYSFIPMRFLPPELQLPWLSEDDTQEDASQAWFTMAPADRERMIRRCIALRLGGDEAGADTPFSQPIIVEEVGEAFVWLWRHGGGRDQGPLISAMVSIEGPTVFVTLKDASTTPPYRIENRQQGVSQEFVRLPPLTWHSFTWQEPRDNVRKLKVAVQGFENEASSFALDEVGRTDTLVVGKSTFLNTGGGGVTPDNNRFHVKVVVRGRTRTILFSDVRNLVKPPTHTDLPLTTSMLLREVYTCLDVDMRIAGLTCNLLETSSRHGTSELLSVTVDQVQVVKRGGKDRAELSIFHIQVDDLRDQPRRPVVFEPVDSGWNSGDQPRALPFIRVLVEPDLGSTQVVHYRSFEATIQEVQVRIDLDRIMYLVAYLGRLASRDSAVDTSKDLRRASILSHTDGKSRATVMAILQTNFEVPDRVKGSSIMYLELLHHSSLILHVDLTLGQQRKGSELDRLGEDEALTTGLELLGSGFAQYVRDIARSFAHVHPTFVFNELLLTHFFGSPSVLARTIVLSMRQQALTQSYKVVGSLDILGNPISMVNRMGNGVMEFFRKTTAEMVGDSDTKGEGVRKLLQGVVGGAFGSAAKITGTVAGLVEGVVGLGDDELQEKPQHLGDGIVQGGQVLYKSMKSGVNGLVDRPIEGAMREGVAGFFKGVGRGLVGAVAAPVVGALGAVSRVTESVDASTHYFDTQRKKRKRRRPRLPLADGTLPLLEGDAARRMEEELEDFEEEEEEEEVNVEGGAAARRWGV